MLLNERQARELLEVLDGVCPRVVAISSCDVYRNYGLLIGIEDGEGTAGRLNEEAPAADEDLSVPERRKQTGRPVV